MSLFKNEYVETHVGDICVYKDRTEIGGLVFITANNFKKYVPIEWIKEWYKKHVIYLDENKPTGKGLYAYEQMIMDWERENGNI